MSPRMSETEVIMNRVWQLAVSLAFIFAVSVASSAEENDGTKQSDAKPTSIEMKSISYDPKSVEVPVGGSIVWTNKAFTNHTSTSEDDGKTFDTGEIKPNASSSPVKFDKEGEFRYHCKIHGKTMSGTITVKPAAAN
jgi:plastocyanin